jgi:hypothetical protein
MLRALQAAGPAADRSAAMMLYGQFVGSWFGTRVTREPQGDRREVPAEVHFSWVLQGRAVQDVWIAPARNAGQPHTYGTTLRVYDPAADHWHIAWTDPITQTYVRMIGRKVGEDIVQECRTERGALRQWLFTEITAEAFHWIWRDAAEDGRGFNVRGEYFLRRAAEP